MATPQFQVVPAYDAVIAGWAPLQEVSVSDWIEEHIELCTGEITGKVQMRYMPYGREILECYGDKSLEHLVMCFPTQTGKALALDTPISTPSGWTTVGDLRVGDMIFGGDGKICRVIYKTEIFTNRECYRVLFGGGTSVVSDAGHLWKVRRRYEVAKRGPNGRFDRIVNGKRRSWGLNAGNDWRDEIVETTDLRFGKSYPHRITTAPPLDLPIIDLPILPYTLGVWLGDGCTTKPVFWGSEDDVPEILDGIKKDGYPIGIIRKEGKRTLRISLNDLRAPLRASGLFGNKHIPDIYLRASTWQRMELLRGLMDTDGTCVKSGTEASYTTINDRLATNVSELLSSLGFKPRTAYKRARLYGKDCGQCFTIKFHPDGRNVFKLARKQKRVTSRVRENFSGHEIIGVNKTDTVPVQCIAVDSEDHTFLCGREMVPTHNTSLLMFGMLYRLVNDPKDAFWVMGNKDNVTSFNKERWQPTVEQNSIVLDLVPRTAKGKINKHMWGVSNQRFRSMWLNFSGAGSSSNLVSRPRGFLQLDEVDVYYDHLKSAAGTIQQAEERMKSFNFPFVVKCSSPTMADRMIWSEYKKTDQRKFWIPCPRCEKPILFKFTTKSEKHGDCGVRWWHENSEEAKTDGEWDLNKVRAMAYYKCQECGGMIHSFEREAMLQEGIWKPDKPGADAKRRGYQINSIYSILSEQTSLAAIAVKFLVSRQTRAREDLQIFVNCWLAEPFDESAMFEQHEVKLELYTPQDIPTAAVPLMAIDVQEGYYWVLIRKFAPPDPQHPYGQSWLLFADRVDTEEELIELQEEYSVAHENVTMDMAHKPNKVGKTIIAHKFLGIWGSDTKKFNHPKPDGTKTQRPFSVVQYRDAHLGTKWQGMRLERVPYILFNKGAALDMVSSLRFHKDEQQNSIWHIIANCNSRYGYQINAMVKRQQKSKKNGRLEWEWVNIHQEDHLLDTECHVTIMALIRGLTILPPESDAQVVIEK